MPGTPAGSPNHSLPRNPEKVRTFTHRSRAARGELERAGMPGSSVRIWLILATLVTADAVLCETRNLSISHCRPIVLAGAGLLAVAMCSRVSGRLPRLGTIAEWTLLWTIFSVAGAVLTYLAAAHDVPLYDVKMAAFDATLGFDANAWFHTIDQHPLLKFALALAYGSLAPQILFSIFWFSRPGWEHRNAELLTNAALALLLATAVFWMFPTFGPYAGMPGFDDLYVADLEGLRHGTLP